MGKPVCMSSITQKDFTLFRELLTAEGQLLKAWFDNKEFAEDREKIGSELEFQLLTQKYQPANCADKFIEKMRKDCFVPEAGQSNVEINTPYYNIEGQVLNNLSHSLIMCCNHSQIQADDDHLIPATLGLLFSVAEINTLKMSDMPRFKVMEESLKKLRKDALIHVSIDGKDHLDFEVDNTAIVLAATNAFQLHMQVKLSESVRFYNASQILAGPMLACSVASPYFLGKSLWQETRITLLEQLTMHENKLNRVEFGEDYMHESLFEFFLRNQQFPALIPCVNNSSLDNLWHLRLHGSTIYRWNRPLIGFSENGCPHLRIEYRALSAGPSIHDMIANTALLIGSVYALATRSKPLEKELAFYKIKNNFYHAAKFGLDAEFLWTENRSLSAVDVLTHDILPLAYEGLEKLDVKKSDAYLYLGIIEERIKSKQTGSSWLTQSYQRNECSFDDLLQTYIANQQKNIPVHAWNLM